MLTLTVGTRAVESFNEETQEFTETIELGEGPVLQLEHSLVSLSKWESEFEKPFLSSDKSEEEVRFYVQCMSVGGEIPPGVLDKLSQHNVDAIDGYIAARQSATVFFDPPGQTSRKQETITSELVYYWMIALQIDFECQHWHLNRLLTLIRVCDVKQSKPKKMGRAEAAARQRQLNAERKAAMKTRG